MIGLVWTNLLLSMLDSDMFRRAALDQDLIIAFLQEYRNGDFRDEDGLQRLSNNAKYKGEIFNIRGLLRARYQGRRADQNMIFKAMRTNPGKNSSLFEQ